MKRVTYLSISLLMLLACKARQAGQTSVQFPSFSAEGHRGGRGLMPENTIIAMKNAIDLGVTTLEMDTHITKDGEVVVTHDDALSPSFMLTPEGKEIPKEDVTKYKIYEMDYATLRKFDIGTKPLAGFPQQKKIATTVPLLSELIDSVQKYLKTTGKKQVFYNIETKCSPQGDGILHPAPDKFVELLIEVIKKKGILPYVVIQSFDKRTLQILHQKYPSVRTSYLIANKKTFEENMQDLGFNPFILSPVYNIVDPALVKKCHDHGVKVIPWTVNTRKEIAELKGYGVDGIISDYPDLLVP